MINYLRYFLPVSFFFLLFLQINCTPKKIASNVTSQIFANGSATFEMEGDVDIAEKTALTMIKMVEAFQYDNPKNKNYLLLLSRSYATYAFGFLEWNMLKYKDVDEAQRSLNEERAKTFYLKGKNYGLQILKRNKEFDQALTQDVDSFKKSLGKFGAKSVPVLFWTAFNWGSWVNLNKDSPLAVAEFPKVEAMMQRVTELDSNYFYAGPHLFFGVSFGSRPLMFGGNPEKSKENFEKALQAFNHKFLMTQVMYAQFYSVQNQDQALFEKLLNEVLAADAAALPEQRLANEIAKLRARWLLDRASTFFVVNPI